MTALNKSAMMWNVSLLHTKDHLYTSLMKSGFQVSNLRVGFFIEHLKPPILSICQESILHITIHDQPLRITKS